MKRRREERQQTGDRHLWGGVQERGALSREKPPQPLTGLPFLLGSILISTHVAMRGTAAGVGGGQAGRRQAELFPLLTHGGETVGVNSLKPRHLVETPAVPHNRRIDVTLSDGPLGHGKS